MSEKPLLIGRLAKLSGVKLDTVRFYERSRLLPKPARTAGGYRVYTDAALNQVRFIRKAQSLGFSLEEIRRIISLRGKAEKRVAALLRWPKPRLPKPKPNSKSSANSKTRWRTNLTRWKRKRRGPIAAEFYALIEATPAE